MWHGGKPQERIEAADRVNRINGDGGYGYGSPASIFPVSTHWVARWASCAAESRASFCLMCSQCDSMVLTLRVSACAIWRLVRP